MVNLKEEKKLGRIILETISEIAQSPKNNVKRFLVLDRNLKRAVKAYRNLTGSDYLLGKTPAYYGLESTVGQTEIELVKDKQTRRHGTDQE